MGAWIPDNKTVSKRMIDRDSLRIVNGTEGCLVSINSYWISSRTKADRILEDSYTYIKLRVKEMKRNITRK